MQTGVELPLRNIHATQSIPWWPLAPGWWLVLAAIALTALGLWWWRRAERLRQQRVMEYFNAQVETGATAPEQIARMSELLRRAGRTKNPDADRLEGTEWLQFLNRGMKHSPFEGITGDLLLTGGFRRDVSGAALDALKDAAAQRFAKWVRDV